MPPIVAASSREAPSSTAAIAKVAPAPKNEDAAARTVSSFRCSSKRPEIVVKVVAIGTGQALNAARRGDADVVFVHAREAEEKFIAQGFGVKRYSVMYNDFVIIGPEDDPAGIKGSRNVAFALQAIKFEFRGLNARRRSDRD